MGCCAPSHPLVPRRSYPADTRLFASAQTHQRHGDASDLQGSPPASSPWWMFWTTTTTRAVAHPGHLTLAAINARNGIARVWARGCSVCSSCRRVLHRLAGLLDGRGEGKTMGCCRHDDHVRMWLRVVVVGGVERVEARGGCCRAVPRSRLALDQRSARVSPLPPAALRFSSPVPASPAGAALALTVPATSAPSPSPVGVKHMKKVARHVQHMWCQTVGISSVRRIPAVTWLPRQPTMAGEACASHSGARGPART